jgi:hypothetical protein
VATATTRPTSSRWTQLRWSQRADGSKDTQTTSDEESEAEVEGEKLESDDEFRDRTTAPVPKWEVLAGDRALWVRLWQQLRLDHGSSGWRGGGC